MHLNQNLLLFFQSSWPQVIVLQKTLQNPSSSSTHPLPSSHEEIVETVSPRFPTPPDISAQTSKLQKVGKRRMTLPRPGLELNHPKILKNLLTPASSTIKLFTPVIFFVQ
jgi:hypothetical protein